MRQRTTQSTISKVVNLEQYNQPEQGSVGVGSSPLLDSLDDMKRPDTLQEKLWRSVIGKKLSMLMSRYRGVLLVTSVPVILILTVLLLVPRSSPLHYDQHHSLKELKHGEQYAIVFDAGSTGSRVHVFKFEVSRKGSLKLISDTFKQLKPGLSSYADEPVKAAESLKPLLEVALEAVPKELQATTPVSLKATAGLRLLPDGKADHILKEVEALLKTYPFALKPNAIAILDGKDEGAFAWLTLNYLLGKLDKGDITKTVAAIDLGGGSVQEAFALTDEAAEDAPAEYVTILKSGGKKINVYVHSYLGYGLMAGRAKVLSEGNAVSQHPCMPAGGSTKYTYAGKDYDFKAAQKPEVAACKDVQKKALEISKPCGTSQEFCSFNGAWRGKDLSKGREYYVSSYFWDRASDTGLIADKDAISWQATPQDFSRLSEEVCSKETATVQSQFKDLQNEAAAQFLCLDLTFCHTLLTTGYKLPANSKVTLVKQVQYNGQNIEAAWPLGAALNDLSP